MNTTQSNGEAMNAGDQTARWRTTKEAGPFLGMSERMLRDTLTKHAKVNGDVTEARFDGIVGRKVGRRWKVWLSDKWNAPQSGEKHEPDRIGRATFTKAAGTRNGGKESHHGSTH